MFFVCPLNSKLLNLLRVVQWLALLLHSARDPGSILALGLCVEFTRSPHVCLGFIRVLRFLPTLQRVRWIGHGKLPLSVREISGVSIWGYGDRTWVGLFLSALQGFYDSCYSFKLIEWKPISCVVAASFVFLKNSNCFQR